MRIGIISAGLLSAMTAGVIANTELIAQNATQETSGVLNAAKASGQAASDQIAREQSSDGSTFNKLAQQAQRALDNPGNTAQQQQLATDARKLDDTIKTLSPEAQKLLSQSSAVPAMRAPDQDAAAVVKAAPAVPVAPEAKSKAAAAEPGKDGVPGEPPAKKDNDIHITSEGVAYFDSKEAIGVFTDEVEVIHPQFHLYCEQLEIYMLKDNEKPKPGTAAAAPAPPAVKAPAVVPGTITSGTTAIRTANPDEAPAPAAGTAAAPEAKAPQPDSSIRQAIARGPKVVIVKNTETGENQIGVCRNATYIGENGDIVLRDMPLVQRGNHVHYATDPSTYMIIKQDGKLDTHGPAKTDIIEEKEKKEAAPGAAPAVPAAPTPATAGPAKPATPKKGKL